jgi:hypothetical protein
MSAWLRRTWVFTRFTLGEYIRSGRIVVELATVAVAEWLLFWPHGASGFDPPQFFSLGGLVILCLAAYTTGAMMSLGNRPQGYVLLTRRLGRSGYFSGLVIAALLLAVTSYLVLLAVVLLVFAGARQPLNVTAGMLAQGTLPLLLDAAVIVAAIALLSPLTLARNVRLAVLAVLALFLASDLSQVRSLDPTGILALLAGVLGVVISPLTDGFALAVEHTIVPAALGILAGQVILAAALFALGLASFSRRELILGS